jgi:hypothetical protein
LAETEQLDGDKQSQNEAAGDFVAGPIIHV